MSGNMRMAAREVYSGGSQSNFVLVQVNVEISLEVKVDFGDKSAGIPFWKSAGVFDR